MNIVVLGATGMAGHVITLYFRSKGHNVEAISNVYSELINNKVIDVTDLDKINYIFSGEFDAIINCIGILNEQAELDKTKSIFLNSFIPHYLAKKTLEIKTKVIQMSTDCVFSGDKGEYYENDFPDGKTFYDRTKALGELNDKKNLTFRNSIIGPDINLNGIGLFNWFMKQKGKINGYNGAIWTGVTTIELAHAMEEAIIQDISGIYNLVNNEKISKFNLLKHFNDIFEKNIEIISIENPKVNKSLINSRLDFDYQVPTYYEMIIRMRDWIINHKNLYMHYLEE